VDKRSILKNFLLISLPTLVVLFLLAEIIFRFVVPACELPPYCFDAEHRILHLGPNQTGIFTAGITAKLPKRWRTNNYGWNSEIDYTETAGRPQKLIAIIGDSYIEAFSVNVNEALPALIRRWAGDQAAVYSFGISGAPLSHYLHLARYVNQVFKPDVLVITVVHNDFDESLASVRRKPAFLQIAQENNGFKEIQPKPFANSSWLRFCRTSATFRYLEINCRAARLFRKDFWTRTNFWTRKSMQFNANIDPQAVRQQQQPIRLATEYLVQAFARENPDKKIIFMIDGPRRNIYRGDLKNSNVIWLNHLLRDIVQKHHLEFIDLTIPFSDHYHNQQEGLNSHADWHWNEVAHQVAARELFQRLRQSGVVSQ
jgi:hypothetical protein